MNKGVQCVGCHKIYSMKSIKLVPVDKDNFKMLCENCFVDNESDDSHNNSYNVQTNKKDSSFFAYRSKSNKPVKKERSNVYLSDSDIERINKELEIASKKDTDDDYEKSYKVSAVPKSYSKPKVSTIKQYRCTRCNYKFKFDESRLGLIRLRCGYCGKNDRLVKE